MYKFTVIRTNSDCRLRKEILPTQPFSDDVSVVTVDPTTVFQTMKGFGGAFTEAAAHVFASLSFFQKHRFLRLCFSRSGLNYHLGRTTIGSCDFSVGSYDYVSNADLSDFSLRHDEKEIIPLIRRASRHHSLFLLASIWSPLACYKDNGDKCHGGHLLPSCYDKEADYVALYVKAMAKEGLPIAALTVQNEPEASQVWESCLYDAPQEAILAEKLAIRLPAVALYAFDHNRDHVVARCQDLFHRTSVFSGVAYHWYDGTQNAEIGKLKVAYPHKGILFTEGCVELLALDHDHPEKAIGNFDAALRYFRNYLLDSSFGTEGFIDWNLLLDAHGGPNHVGNYCEAPLMVNPDGKLRVNFSYDAIYHFAHYVMPGAQRIALSGLPSDLLAVAFQNPDGSLIIEALLEGTSRNIGFQIENIPYLCYFSQNELITITITERGTRK
jgi:glucosylceramidase